MLLVVGKLAPTRTSRCPSALPGRRRPAVPGARAPQPCRQCFPSPSRSGRAERRRAAAHRPHGRHRQRQEHRVRAMLRELGAVPVDTDAISRATTAAGGAAMPAIAAIRRRLHWAGRRPGPRPDARARACASGSAARAGAIIHPLVGRDRAPGGRSPRERAPLHRVRRPAAGRVRPLARARRSGAGGRLRTGDAGARVVARSALGPTPCARSSPRRPRARCGWRPPTPSSATRGRARRAAQQVEQVAQPSGYDRPPPASQRHASRVILYEYPFNERIRTYLRLEHLFRRLGELVPADSALSPPLRARHDLRDHGRGRARRPQGRRAARPRQAQATSSTAIAAIRPSPRRCSTRSIGQLERNFTTLNTMPGQGRPVADRKRVADEHPQPRRHSGRHLRVRPAGLLRLAAPGRRAAAPTWSAGPPRSRRWPNRSTCCSSCCAMPTRPTR